MAGMLVCLFIVYIQLPRIFLPGLGGWSSFRVTRLQGLLQRFLWLTWLTGIALMMSVDSAVLAQGDVVLRDKLLLLFLLSASTLGLDLVMRHAFMAREGGVTFLRGVRDGLMIRLSLAVSLTAFAGALYLLYGYMTGEYRPGITLLIGSIGFPTSFALLLALDDRWVNFNVQSAGERKGAL